MTEYLQFIRGLANKTFRTVVQRDNIPLMSPFDSIVSDVLSMENPGVEQIYKVAKLHLHQDDYTKLVRLDEEIELSLASYKKLVEESIREEALKKLQYGTLAPVSDVLDDIGVLLKKRHVSVPEIHSKKWEDLSERDDDVMFQYMKYNISRGKLSLTAAFSGIGKTVNSLCFANFASANGFNVLMIALKDWSEAELKRKCSNIPVKENIAFAVYGDCSLSDIDYEIQQVKPDVVIIDALTDISMRVDDKLHRTIGEVSASLREMAVTYDCHVFTTHQTNTLEPIVMPSHLRDSKSNLLQAVDICWGIGMSSPSDTVKIISTVKLRHQEAVRPWKCVFDYNGLEIHEKGLYDTRAGMFKRT